MDDSVLDADLENHPFHDRIHTGDGGEIYRLHPLIKLTEVNPGEPPYMKRKMISNSIRFHKIKDRDSHGSLYCQLVLYHPFQQECVDLKQGREDKRVCEDKFLYPANPHLIGENQE